MERWIIKAILEDFLKLQMHFDTTIHDSRILKSCTEWNLNPFCSVKAASCKKVKVCVKYLCCVEDMEYINTQQLHRTLGNRLK